MVFFRGEVFALSVRIYAVTEGSPAEKAGLRPGDVIVKIDDRPTANIYDVQSIILSFYNPGDTAEFIFVRGGKVIKTKVRFE